MIGLMGLVVSRWVDVSLDDQSAAIVGGLIDGNVVDGTRWLWVVKHKVVNNSRRCIVVDDEV